MSKSLLCVHLLDDFSGSAKVFAGAVAVLQRAGHATRVVVGSHGAEGFIRRQHEVETLPYHFHASKVKLFMSFAMVQLRLFLHVWRILRTGQVDAVYVNTVLPVGAMIAGYLCRRPVITHLHEVGLGTKSLFRLLLACTLLSSSRLITVSNYVGQALGLPLDRTTVIYNSLEPVEWTQASLIASRRCARAADEPFRVLMACSLKWYKGVDSFLALARHCKAVQKPVLCRVVFTLILNCELEEFTAFRDGLAADENIELLRRPSSVYDHYKRAHLVLNLSLPEGWVETFGLTLLEAMSCGVPVVCPTVGGCTELFEPGQGGWRIDGHDIAGIATVIQDLSVSLQTWDVASARALAAASRFSPAIFAERLTRLFTSP